MPENAREITPPVACVRSTRRKTAQDIIIVSSEERALVAEFLRLIRSNYWLSHFVKNLLRLDSQSPNLVPITEVEAQLGYQRGIEELVHKVQFIGKTGWYRDHPVINAIAEEWDDVYEYKGESAINKLIESATKRKV